MTNEYIALPRATSAPFDVVVVSTGAATLKTVLQVATPATTAIKLLGWGVSFDSSAAAQPGYAHLLETGTVAATVTTLTPDKWGNPQSPASLCVGGTAATGYNASAEGTITAVRSLDAEEVYPQSGYSLWWPEGHQPMVDISAILRIRTKFPASINVIPWIIWAEPAV